MVRREGGLRSLVYTNPFVVDVKKGAAVTLKLQLFWRSSPGGLAKFAATRRASSPYK